MALSKKQVKQLRAMANQLNPLLYIGKNDLTDAAVKQASETMDSHELLKVAVQDGSGLTAKEAADKLAGQIGAQVVRNLSGFGCRILAYDLRRNPAVEPQVTYVDFDTLLAQSDVITLHMPLLDSNRHIINRESIAKMRDGVVIVNCSRGELADIEALIEGIETGKIGALGMDTVEGDEGIIHADHRVDILPNRNWFYLHQFRNVIMTQHMAFYTDAAVSSMVDCGIGGICQMAAGESCPTELTGPVQ